MCVRLIYLVPQVTYQHSVFISEPLSAQNTRLGREGCGEVSAGVVTGGKYPQSSWLDQGGAL